MQKSRLIEILQTFSKKEFRELKKWLHSPAHNQRQDVIALYEYLVKNDRLEKVETLAKEKVFPIIYPKEQFDDAKMRQVMHFMFKAVESYLVYAKLEQEDIQVKLSLLNIYRQRKLGKNFSKTQRDIAAYFDNVVHNDEDNFYNNYLFQKEVYEYNSIIKRAQTLNLQELTDTFDKAFIAEKLKQACLILSHQKLYNAEYETGLLDSVLNFIEEKDLPNTPRVNIYYSLYKITLDRNNTKDFFTLKKHIQEDETIPKTEIRSIYLGAINFCILLMNSGDEQFIREAFDLYKNGMEKEIFIEKGILSRWTFRNVIAIALRLKEFEWAENFIRNYGPFLEEKHKESFIHFNLAKLFHEKGAYNDALDMLNKYEFKDILMNLNAKTMLLKIYYELDEFQVLESLLESMRAYLQRKKKMIGSQYLELYKNIIRYTKKILKVNPFDKAQVAKLRQEIETATPLTEKKWLLKQVDSL